MLFHTRKSDPVVFTIDIMPFMLYDVHTFPKDSSFGNLSAAVFMLCAESGRSAGVSVICLWCFWIS